MEDTPKMISITPIIKHIKIDHSPNALTLVFQIIDSRSRSLKIQQSIITTMETAEKSKLPVRTTESGFLGRTRVLTNLLHSIAQQQSL